MRRQLRMASVLVSLGLLVGAGAASYSSSSSDIYVVQPGDSLWAISRHAGISVDQLAAANNLNPNGLLLIGTRLYVPAAESAVSNALETSSTDSGPGTGNTGGGGDPSTFCSTFTPDPGPTGVLPALLSESPNRLALQPVMVRWAEHYGLSLPLLEAIDWQESGWQQGVVSPTGAVGVGQIEPGTATFIGTSLIGEAMNIGSVSDNIRMSAAFLAHLADIEGNNLCDTIAAYYEGPLNLRQYGVFADTQAYVASVEALIPRFQ